MNSLVVGIDIGGSHITVALIDLENRTIQKDTLCREMINSNGTLEEIIGGWCDSIKKSISTIAGQEIYIGIAMPGPFDYQDGISHIKEQDKYKALYKVNVKQALAAALDISPDNIRFINDAASFLRGEVFSGSAQGCQRVFGVTLGTGFGSALFESGEAKDANLWCAPFKEGIAEDYFSTRWFVKRYKEKTNQEAKSVKELSALHSQDSEVRELFAEFGENLGDFFKEILQKEHPEMIVLGGNISGSFDYFNPSLQRRLGMYQSTVCIKKSLLNEYASLLGAASCWSQMADVTNRLLI